MIRQTMSHYKFLVKLGEDGKGKAKATALL